jgi:hypothetical protein
MKVDLATAIALLPNGTRIERECDVWQIQPASWLPTVNHSDLTTAVQRAVTLLKQEDRGMVTKYVESPKESTAARNNAAGQIKNGNRTSEAYRAAPGGNAAGHHRVRNRAVRPTEGKGQSGVQSLTGDGKD